MRRGSGDICEVIIVESDKLTLIVIKRNKESGYELSIKWHVNTLVEVGMRVKKRRDRRGY